jgi:hypothetical protein
LESSKHRLIPGLALLAIGEIIRGAAAGAAVAVGAAADPLAAAGEEAVLEVEALAAEVAEQAGN